MKPQSIQRALPTESLLLCMEDFPAPDESKLHISDCLTIILQLSVSLGVCGLVHWAVT